MKIESLPSIFNDVIGPVMRGPSSSHTAASWRIANISMQLLGDELQEAIVEFDEQGAWASNYREQGTAMGMDGGLLGIDISDERIIHPEKLAKERGIRIQYRITSFKTDHENTVRVSLIGRSGKKIRVRAVSVGGGMFEIREFIGFETHIKGDRYHLLLRTAKGLTSKDLEAIRELISGEVLTDWSENEEGGLFQVSASEPFPETSLKKIRSLEGILELITLVPILPVISGRELEYPFTNTDELFAYADSKGYSLGKSALVYESCRSGLTEKELIQKMKEIVRVIEEGIADGLAGTEFQDRILHQQSDLIGRAEQEKSTGTDPLVNRIIANITALMEAKSALRVIVAAPTAGGCGTFGGTLKAFCDSNDLNEEQKIMAYFAGGLMGVFFAMGPGFSAEEHGCQVETGAAATMAAAALVDLSGGNVRQAVGAASMAMQNCIGLVCDPVADRVEVPCLGRNVTAGMNALGASTMALSGFQEVIPFEQVLDTVSKVGRSISPALRCTGKGGLSVTAASIEIKRILQDRQSG